MTKAPSNGQPHDVEMLIQMSNVLARIEERVSAMSVTVADVHATVRGHGETPGLVAKVDAIIEDVIRIEKYHLELEEVKKDLADLRSEHEALKRRVEDHPSYLWLLRNKTKETIAATLAIAFVSFMLMFPVMAPDQAAAAWKNIFTMLFRFAGLPIDIK